MFKYSIRRIFILLLIIFIIVAIAECGRKKKKKGKKIAIGQDEPSSSSSSKIETKNEQNANEKLEEDLLAVKKENIELKNEMEKLQKENVELKNEIAKMEEKSKYFGECPICMNPFKLDDISTLNCGHTYHHKCIKRWIDTKEECPKCRRKNNKGDIIPLFIDEPNKSTNDEMKNDGIELAEYDWNAYKLNAAADRSTKLTISEEGIVATNSDGWNCIRSVLPIPAFNLNGINKPLITFYFEIEILRRNGVGQIALVWSKQNSSLLSTSGIGIGFCDQQFPLQGKVIGLEDKSNSIGIWSKEGILIDGNMTTFGNDDDKYFKEGDFVGIGIIHHPNSNMECFATLNGQLLGKAELPQKFAKLPLFPVVALFFSGDLIRVNFGKDEWKFENYELLLE